MQGIEDVRKGPPGERAQRIVQETQRLLSPSIQRFYPFVIRRGKGAMLEDVDGNRYIDMNAGIAVLALGTAPDPVIRAIERQIRKFIHYSYTDFYYENIVKLARKLIQITPGRFEKRVYFGNSGAEAVEAAIKLTRYHTRRPRFLAYIGAFHGRTMGALSLTASKPAQVKGFSPLIPGVEHVPYPYCYRCPFKLTYPECGLYCVDYIKENLFQKYVPPDEVAAAFIEPIQGEGGYVVPPEDYFRKFFRLMRENGILVVDDEVQAGMGRTGKWFAIEHFGVEPDVVLVAKAIASGLPLSALISKAELMDWPPGSHATTFGGNPVAVEAALATIRTIEKMKLMRNAERVGAAMMKRLNEMKEKYEIVGDVRGKGLMIGAEIVKDKRSREPNPDGARRIVEYSWRHGVLLITAGVSTLRFSPPLVITERLAMRALDVVEEGIKEAMKA
ncbi:MAG: acetyl ornithine aminotransferase family protein [Nitrososphaeria archaeon]